MTWASLHRALAARRRVVAALLAGLAVLASLSALRPPGPPTVHVLAAARDLAAGAALTLDDLRSVALPAGAVPAGALEPGASVLGRLVAGPVRAGEPLTDVRLVGPALLSALAPGAVAVPVRFADGGAVALLRPGDRIDVLAADADAYAGVAAGDTALALLDAVPGGPAPAAAGTPGPAPPLPPARAEPATARAVAVDVVVLAVPTDDDAVSRDGALVVVACTPAVARALAAAAAHAQLSPALRAPQAPPAVPGSPDGGRGARPAGPAPTAEAGAPP
ncbi:MAG TPA: Flp pilus assembly protein CpaB [Frankiaceae bacterium]|nr:Flp pilus assembly protein CpaB [Frankiaceae bacterium]